MATTIRKGLAHRAVSMAAVMLLALGALGVQDASAQVAKTKHNLSKTQDTGTKQDARNNYSADTEQVCVFCHTPHGAKSDKAPLWQRNIDAASTYSTYSSTGSSPTMDAATDRAIGSVSIACLSCHDGTQAINVLANAPGAGGKDGAMLNWTRGNSGATMNADYTLAGTVRLDKDLQNDHPIGIIYGGGVDAKSGGYSTIDPQFVEPKHVSINSKSVWYVDNTSGEADIGTVVGSRDKRDIALFTRDKATGDTTTLAYQPYVECSSCHDPHLNEKLFLRVTPDGSKICLACHIK